MARSNSLTFGQLQEANRSRCERWHPGGVADWTGSDWGIAAAGEMGEALNYVKKLNRVRDDFPGNTQTERELLDGLARELADTTIYLDLLAQRYNIDLGYWVTRKFNEVSEKNDFPERLL